MSPSFTPADWVIGLVLVGLPSLMLLCAIAVAGHPLRALVAAGSVLILSIGAAVAIDMVIQLMVSPEFLAAGSHKRRALRSFAPWPLGVSVGFAATWGGVVGARRGLDWVMNREMNRARAELAAAKRRKRTMGSTNLPDSKN
jgi:hypothetical protein